MQDCGTLLRTALLALVLIAASGSATEKVSPCCTAVDQNEINEKIVNYWVQKADPPCVNAVIFQTETELLCKFVRAGWVFKKIKEFHSKKAREAKSTSASLISLLSTITPTTSSPPSTSTIPASSSSTSSSTIPSSSSSSSSSSSTIPSSTSFLSSSSTSEMFSGEDPLISE